MLTESVVLLDSVSVVLSSSYIMFVVCFSSLIFLLSVLCHILLQKVLLSHSCCKFVVLPAIYGYVVANSSICSNHMVCLIVPF